MKDLNSLSRKGLEMCRTLWIRKKMKNITLPNCWQNLKPAVPKYELRSFSSHREKKKWQNKNPQKNPSKIKHTRDKQEMPTPFPHAHTHIHTEIADNPDKELLWQTWVFLVSVAFRHVFVVVLQRTTMCSFQQNFLQNNNEFSKM